MDLNDLHKERAELAEIESEAADAKKFFVVGGFWWHVFSWFERRAAQDRQDVEKELEEAGYQVIRHDRRR
jgi:hypothetical protein